MSNAAITSKSPGEILKELREEKQLNREHVAAAINESPSSINNWERGDRQIKAEPLIALAKFYGVSTDYILGLTDTKSPEGTMRSATLLTGLSEEAIKTLMRIVYDPRFEIRSRIKEALDEIICSDSFVRMLFDLDQAVKHYTNGKYAPDPADHPDLYKLKTDLEKTGNGVLSKDEMVEYYKYCTIKRFQNILDNILPTLSSKLSAADSIPDFDALQLLHNESRTE